MSDWSETPKTGFLTTGLNYDKPSSSPILGGVQLGINSKGDRLKHWFECLKGPDQKHEYWHVLSAELIPEVQ